MASSDPKQGGDLFDMAKDGTNIPEDGGITHRLIPSVPRPDQMPENYETNTGGLGAPDATSAADNAVDMPRGPGDMGTTGEVITGTGDQMPGVTESKIFPKSGKNVHMGKGTMSYDRQGGMEAEESAGGERPAPE